MGWIGQVAANIYFNPEKATNSTHPFLDLHNVRDKFTHFTVIYVNNLIVIKTGSVVNLKRNA